MRDQVISITPDRVVFDGPLGALKQHSHAVLALLVGIERRFRLTTSRGSVSCAAALVPPSVLHSLDFGGGRTLVVYVEPHVPDYAAFHRGAAGACPTLGELDRTWRRALSTWSSTAEVVPLLGLARDAFGDATARLDRRVGTLAGCFSRGELLEAPMSEMATRVRLSPSRLIHLLKDELGVGARRLKQHYRFKLVALATERGENLTSAAHGAGFADSGHFSRSFLETFGLNPSRVLLR